jgi:hypothetical protein
MASVDRHLGCIDRMEGRVGRRFALHVTPSAEDDAYESFRSGDEYLVFTEPNPPQKSERFGLNRLTYGAHGCGGTGLVAQSSSYLRDLGQGRPVS